MKLLSLTLFLSLISTVISAKDYQILSPDGKIKVTVSVDKEIKYSVQYENLSVIKPSTVSFTFRQAPPLGNNMEVVSDKKVSFDDTWKPVLKRFESIRNNYNGIRFEMKEKKFPARLMNLEFRVFNDGAAFRTEFPEQQFNHEYVISDELSQFNFASNHTCWAVNYGSYTTSQEVEHFERKI